MLGSYMEISQTDVATCWQVTWKYLGTVSFRENSEFIVLVYLKDDDLGVVCMYSQSMYLRLID